MTGPTKRKGRFDQQPSLNQQAGRSALWQIMGGGWQTIIRLGASTILARKLNPFDFGLFGMALLVTELIMVLTNLGMGTGIIAKKDVTEKDLNTCFWTMAGVRIVMFILAETCAPLAASFFKDPRVTNVVRVVGFNFLFTLPGVVANTLLTKELRFKALVLIRGFSALIESSLAVFLVLTTNLRYWSLVIPMLLASFLAHTTIFFVARWRPRFEFDHDSFRYLFRYGINGLGFSITNYLHQNVDYFMVGRLLGTASMGLYEFAYKIPHLVLDRVSRPVGAVVFPTLSKVQDDDEQLIAGFIKAVKYVTLLVYPMLGGLAVLAKDIVLMLWGQKWLPIVHPLQILCLCAAIRCSVQPIGSIFLCKNRPDIPFKFSLATFLFTLVFVAIGGYFYGLIGVAIGMLISTVPYWYILNLAFKMTNSSVLWYLKALFPGALSTLVCIFFSYLVLKGISNFQYGLVTLGSSILAGVLGYMLALYILFRSLTIEVIGVASSLIKRN